MACRGGAEVAGWTLDRKIRVRFPAYPHRVWVLWWQGGKRRLRTSRCPCRGRLGTLKTPSCPWRGCPAAGQNLETGHLSRHYIAEISLNVTLNHHQQQQQIKPNEIHVTFCYENVNKAARVKSVHKMAFVLDKCFALFLYCNQTLHLGNPDRRSCAQPPSTEISGEQEIPERRTEDGGQTGRVQQAYIA